MAKYKVVHEIEKCIGCGACAAIDEKRWKMNNDGKASLKGAKKEGENYVLEVSEADKKKIIEAAESCPVNCIYVHEGKKKLI